MLRCGDALVRLWNGWGRCDGRRLVLVIIRSGVAAGIIFVFRRRANLSGLAKWPNQVHIPVVLIAGALIAVLAAHPPAFLERPYDLTVTIIVFPALVFIGASNKPSDYWTRVFLGLGLASYGVYVLQTPVYGIASKVLPKLTSVSSLTPLSGFAFIVFLFLLALATDYLFDLPVRQWLVIHVEKRIFLNSHNPPHLAARE